MSTNYLERLFAEAPYTEANAALRPCPQDGWPDAAMTVDGGRLGPPRGHYRMRR